MGSGGWRVEPPRRLHRCRTSVCVALSNPGRCTSTQLTRTSWQAVRWTAAWWCGGPARASRLPNMTLVRERDASYSILRLACRGDVARRQPPRSARMPWPGASLHSTSASTCVPILTATAIPPGSHHAMRVHACRPYPTRGCTCFAPPSLLSPHPGGLQASPLPLSRSTGQATCWSWRQATRWGDNAPAAHTLRAPQLPRCSATHPTPPLPLPTRCCGLATRAAGLSVQHARLRVPPPSTWAHTRASRGPDPDLHWPIAPSRCPPTSSPPPSHPPPPQHHFFSPTHNRLWQVFSWHFHGAAEPIRILKTRRSLRALHFHPLAPYVLLTAEVTERRGTHGDPGLARQLATGAPNPQVWRGLSAAGRGSSRA